MTFNAQMNTIKLIAACALFLGATAVAIAQPVYRIVGPDGKVTFSDKPPAEPNAKVTNAAGASGGGVAGSSLPFELRQVAQKYPVTLYTGENCGPCQSARSMLITRGVPFAEKTVTTVEDSQALQRLSGETSLPFATIGGQQLKGFSDAEWTQFLNAAGYPATSTLPSSYRQSPATPLVTVAAAPATTAPAAPARPAAAAPAPQPTPAAANPSGIRF
jgi:glutaredoxin